MASTCPKCARNVPDDAIYCPYCGKGLKPSARTITVSVGGALMIVAAIASLIIFLLSLEALLEIYNWYPRLVAQKWFLYDQLFTVLSLIGFLSGVIASVLSLARKGYLFFILAGTVCTFGGAGVWITSMIIPNYTLSSSFLYYFLPIFLPSLVGTLLVLQRKPEFR
jgi:hypothetical protein